VVAPQVNGGAAAGLIVMFFGSFDPGGNCIGLLRGWVGVAAPPWGKDVHGMRCRLVGRGLISRRAVVPHEG
jgi:hypothetical protein